MMKEHAELNENFLMFKRLIFYGTARSCFVYKAKKLKGPTTSLEHLTRHFFLRSTCMCRR